MGQGAQNRRPETRFPGREISAPIRPLPKTIWMSPALPPWKKWIFKWQPENSFGTDKVDIGLQQQQDHSSLAHWGDLEGLSKIFKNSKFEGGFFPKNFL